MKDYEQRERDLANMGHKDLIRFMRHAYNWLLDDGMSESELEASLAKFGLCKEDIFGRIDLRIKMTYTDQERAAFERVRAELLQSLPNVRQHSSTAPGGIHVFYLTTCKK